MGQQQEEFRPVPGYEGLYEVSNFGTVKSLEREILTKGKYTSTIKERIRKVNLNNSGYLQVILSKDSKSTCIRIHTMVAMAFLGHKPDGTHRIVVDHIDNNKLNNHVSNLQLISNRENLSKDKKNGTSKYTGVSWHKASNKWRSQIRLGEKSKDLGFFTSEEVAAEEYQKALKIYHDGGDLSFMEPRIPSSKYTGVSWKKRENRWVSYIKIDGKLKHLGLFTSEEDAAEARQKALKMYNEGDLSFMETRIPSSQYKGVSWDKNANKWKSHIKIDGKQTHLGSFTSEEAAAEVYQNALKEKMNAE